MKEIKWDGARWDESLDDYTPPGWIRAPACYYKRDGDYTVTIVRAPNLYYGKDGWRLTRWGTIGMLAWEHDTVLGGLVFAAERWLKTVNRG